jgi:hypothetical protein
MAAQVFTRHDQEAKIELPDADLERVAGGTAVPTTVYVTGGIAWSVIIGVSVSAPVSVEVGGW